MQARSDSSPLPDVIPLTFVKPSMFAAPIQESALALQQLSVSKSSSSSVKSKQRSDSKIEVTKTKISNQES